MNLSPSGVLDILNDGAPRYRPDPWWLCAARDATIRGHYFAIGTRDGSSLYLLRFWLSAPVASEDERWDSQRSVLLHYFLRGDDDEALHDHPWDFTTTILCGGYDEHLPPEGWMEWEQQFPAALGPSWDERIVPRRAGDQIAHAATDLHCVGRVEPGTWTLVATGQRTRRWGFHPPGRPWIYWRDYLDSKPAAQEATP